MLRIRYLPFVALLFSGFLSLAGPVPQTLSVADLVQSPGKFEGRLVTVKGWLLMGWEGDNFLFDRSAISNNGSPLPGKQGIWIYAKPLNEKQVFGAINATERRVFGAFTGYFHFVPSKESRLKDVFDPGPYQLQAIWAFDHAQ